MTLMFKVPSIKPRRWLAAPAHAWWGAADCGEYRQTELLRQT